MEVEFVVEHAGCAACAERVRVAVTTFGVVREIEIDEADDSASVRADFPAGVSRDAVDRSLVEVSVGSGHEYRVRPRSWRAAG